MTATFSDQYSLDVCNEAVTALLPGCLLCLFKSSHAPADSDVIGTYTAIESTFPGYARATLSGWSAAVIAAHIATTTAAPETFTRSTTGATESVYGYFVLDPTATFLLWAEADPAAPIGLTNSGDQYVVTASVSFKSSV